MVLSVILFNKDKIVARYDASSSSKIDLEAFLTLSIFERVEYADVDNGNNPKFDPAFVESPNNNTLKHNK